MGHRPSEMGTGQFPGKTELGHLSRALWGSPEEPPSGGGQKAGGGGLRPLHTPPWLDLTSAWLRLNRVLNGFTFCSPKGNDQGWGQLNLLQAQKESAGLPEPSSCPPRGNKLLSSSPWGSCCGGTPPLAPRPGLPSAPTSHCSSSVPRVRALVADSTSVWTPLYVEIALTHLLLQRQT